MKLDKLPPDLHDLLCEFVEACAQPGSSGKQARIGRVIMKSRPMFTAWSRDDRPTRPERRRRRSRGGQDGEDPETPVDAGTPGE